MVVVVMGDDDGVDDGYVGDLAGWWGVAFGAHEGEGRASVFEDRVKENAEAIRIFDEVAGVAKPSCAELVGGCARGEEGGRLYGHGWRGGIRGIGFAREATAGHGTDYGPRREVAP